jgi:hypothetical protein
LLLYSGARRSDVVKLGPQMERWFPNGAPRSLAVIYARVSSKEQEKEGFSISARLKLLREYAAVQDFIVAEEYVDVETAKQTGRAAFGEMVAYLKAHPAVRVLLVEKTDLSTGTSRIG